MHRSSSRRRQLIRRTIVYSLMTVAVIAGSIVLVFLMLGYRFNKQSGTFSQGGLVQFVTRPSGASVTVGIAHLANKTPSKITLNPGKYDVVMEKDGYLPWKKTVNVVPGTVLWLNSARLIPASLTTEPMMSLKTLSSMAVRPTGHYIALLTDDTTPTVVIANMSGNTLDSQTITVPAGSYTDQKGHFTLGDWSQGDDYLLVKHVYGKHTEWIALNRDNPTSSQRIAPVGSSDPGEVYFDPRASDRAFVLYGDHTVRTVDLRSGKVSDVLLKNITSLSFAKDRTLFFTAKTKTKTTTGYLSLGSSAPRTIATYKTTEAVWITGNYYLDHVYVTTAIGKKLTVAEAGSLPSSGSDEPLQLSPLVTLDTKAPTVYLTNHASGRFVAAEQSRSQTVYDLETGRHAVVPIEGATTDLKTPLDWLDPYTFWSDQDGSLHLYEFDGTNQHSLTNVAPGFKAVITPNEKFIYSIGKTKSGYQLQRTGLIAD